METYSFYIPTNTYLVENFIAEMTLAECLLDKDYTITMTDHNYIFVNTTTYDNYNILRKALLTTLRNYYE